jgi:hypothetical protein
MLPLLTTNSILIAVGAAAAIKPSAVASNRSSAERLRIAQ